jgi:HEAT repeat protein
LSLRVDNGFLIACGAGCALGIFAIVLFSSREPRSDANASSVVTVRAPAPLQAAAEDPANASGPRVSVLDRPNRSEGPRSLGELRAALANPDSNIRLDAVADLGDLDEAQAASLLAEVVSHDADPSVRADAVRAMGGRRVDALDPVLLIALTDGDAGVRKAAIRAIESTGFPSSLPILELALQDRDVSVRAAAVDAIAEIGGDGARRQLESALADESVVVREAAAEHIFRMR